MMALNIPLIPKMIIGFEIFIGFILLILIIVLIRKRIKDKRNETFEKRKY